MKSRKKSDAAVLSYASRAPASPLTPAPTLDRRIVVILVGAVLFLGIVGMYAGVFIVEVVKGFATDGLLVAAQVLSAAMLGAVVLKISRPASRTLGFVTAAGVGLGLIALLALGLGVAGWLNRWTAIVLLIIGPIMDLPARIKRLKPASVIQWLNEPAGWGWLWLAAVPMLAIACTGASMMPGLLWKPLDPHPFDVTAYHLQVPREWYESGRITPLPHNVYSYFPFLMEMHYLLQMHLLGGPWAAMYSAQLLSAAMGVLFVLAVQGGMKESLRIREDTQSAMGATIAAVLAAAVPWVAMIGAVAYVENALLFYSTAALAWVMRALARRNGRARTMVVGGVLAGFACGVKYTAVPAVVGLYALAFAVAMGVRIYRRGAQDAEQKDGLTETVGATAAFAAVAMVVFSPWAIRNFAWSGNPVFPLALRTLGPGRFDQLQVERFERAHRASEQDAPMGRRIRSIWGRVVADRQYGYVLIPIGLVGFILTGRRDDAWLLMIIGLGTITFFLCFTHLMPRFALGIVPVLAMGAGIAAAACGWRWVRVLSVGSVFAAALSGFIVLHLILWDNVAGARQALFRMPDPALLNPDEIASIVNTDAPIALIGHSQPFMITVPMHRLKYRMVFDVPSSPGADALDAWLSIREEDLRRTGRAIIVDPLELRRYAQTYWRVPELGGKTVAPGYVVVSNDMPLPPGYAVQQADGTWRVEPRAWKDVVGLHHIWRP